jgi:hypothetical protein
MGMKKDGGRDEMLNLCDDSSCAWIMRHKNQRTTNHPQREITAEQTMLKKMMY